MFFFSSEEFLNFSLNLSKFSREKNDKAAIVYIEKIRINENTSDNISILDIMKINNSQ